MHLVSEQDLALTVCVCVGGGKEQLIATAGAVSLQQAVDAFTKPPLFQRNGLTCSDNPLFKSCVEGKAKQREIAVYSRSSFQRPQH